MPAPPPGRCGDARSPGLAGFSSTGHRWRVWEKAQAAVSSRSLYRKGAGHRGGGSWRKQKRAGDHRGAAAAPSLSLDAWLGTSPSAKMAQVAHGGGPGRLDGGSLQRVCSCVQHLPMCARRVGERPEQGGARVWGNTQHGGGKPCRARGALRPMSRGPEHLCCRQACPKASWVPRSVHSSKRHRRDTKPAHVPSLALLDA